jgi:hypothetical protein
MHGGDARTGELISNVDLEDRVRRDHPLRAIRQIVNDALVLLEREFAALYSPVGRPSIAPEKLLRAMLLQAFYTIRSERLLVKIVAGQDKTNRVGWAFTLAAAAYNLVGLPKLMAVLS